MRDKEIMYNQILSEDSSKMIIGRDYVVDKDGVIRIRSALEKITIHALKIGIALMLIVLFGWIILTGNLIMLLY